MVVIRGLEEGEMETCYCMCTQLQFYMVWVSQDWHERKLTDTRCYLLSTTEGSFLTSSHLSFSLNIYLAVQGLYFSKRDLAPWPGIEPGLPVLAAKSLSCWTTVSPVTTTASYPRDFPAPGANQLLPRSLSTIHQRVWNTTKNVDSAGSGTTYIKELANHSVPGVHRHSVF